MIHASLSSLPAAVLPCRCQCGWCLLLRLHLEMHRLSTQAQRRTSAQWQGLTVWPAAQPLLTRLLTVDLPGLMVLPKRLEINIPPAVTSVAEAAVGHDIIMQAVASAVLQACSPWPVTGAAMPARADRCRRTDTL